MSSSENDLNIGKEDIKEEVQDAVKEQETSETNQETDEIKEKAKTTGHLTKDEWIAQGGKPEEYKTEKEYVLTGELIDLKKTLQKRDKDIEAILKYQEEVIAAQKQKFKQELQQRLEIAKQNGDADAIEQLTTEKLKQENTDQAERQQKQMAAIHQLDTEFLSRNKAWWDVPELNERSKEIDALIRVQYPDITYAQLLNRIEKQMKFELSQDDRYKHLTVDTSKIVRPNLSSSSSNIAKSSASRSDTEAGSYDKLSSNDKHMYGVLSRIAKKVNKTYTVTEYLKSKQRDEEI